ncbi:MAG: RNA polymerase sigma factor [Planctomycetota bacterium]|nr:RNA polymerase sigma factor [Planctomycetota bacterium]
MSQSEKPSDLKNPREAIRGAFLEMMGQVKDFHSALHRYACGLTGNVWDAEDLCQEAILRAFGRIGLGGDEIKDLRAYLFRVATNLWLDQCRKKQPMLMELPEAITTEDKPYQPDIGIALERLATALPPRERSAVLLKDVVGFTLNESAETLDISLGAVKAALHRGRQRLGTMQDESPVTPVQAGLSPELVDSLVSAFNSRDVPKLLSLMTEDAETDLLGVMKSRRKDTREMVIGHTLEDPSLKRAEIVTFQGSPLILLWHDVKGEEVIMEVLRIEVEGDKISKTRWYYFCPDSLRYVGKTLNIPVQVHGFHGVK